jgi:hypothetical protein
MTCEHYWRDGILRVECGDPDPHRDSCADCRREHQAREQLIDALSLVGGTQAGDRNWEARVWSRIARLEPARAQRRWWLRGGFATAFAAVLMWWVIGHRDQLAETRPRIEVVPALPGEVAMRSTSPCVGDRVRIAVKPTDEVRIYRADRLVLQCPAGATGGGCASDARGMVAEARLAAAGEYQLVIIRAATAAPVGRIDLDLRAVVLAGGDYQITALSVL